MDTEIILCHMCKKSFKVPANYHRHLREKHRVGHNGEKLPPMKKAEKKTFSCSKCQWTFKTLNNLRRHMKNIHPSDNDERFKCGNCDFETTYMYYLKRHMKKHDNEKPKSLQCAYCEDKFEDSDRLKAHESKVHNNGNKKKVVYYKTCPLCSFVSRQKLRHEIYAHFRAVHNLPISWESHTFDSLNAFREWKSKLEKSTTVQYKATNHNPSYFICRNNYSKEVGSVGRFCPSAISVELKDDGHVCVKYMPCHVGHENDVGTSKEERQKIGQELKTIKQKRRTKQTPEDSILADIGKSLTNKNNLNTFITKQDLDDIKKTFNIDNKTVKPSESCNDWVEKLKTDTNTSLFYFKPQGVVSDDFQDLTEDECILVYMSNAQKSILKAYGNNIVCVDSSCRLNDDYNLQLFTILVVDSTKQSLPVAFMFTNRKCLDDELVISIFFQKVKKLIGCLIPNVLMTDVGDTVNSAWCRIMGPPKMHIFFTSRVLKAWQDNLIKIKCKDKQQYVFNVLKTLLYNIDREDFHKSLIDCLNNLKDDIETQEYFHYFQSEFVQNMRYKRWAHCCLNGLNLEVTLDSMQKFLNQCCMRVKNLQNFDEILSAVLNLSHEIIFKCSVAIEKNVIRNKVKALELRHKKSLFTTDTILSRITGDTWEVMTSTGKEFYIVKKVRNCSQCQLLCVHCKSCWHEFVCTCGDFVMRNNMCVHIHLVARSLINSQQECVRGDATLKESSSAFNTLVPKCERIVYQDEETQGDVIIEDIVQDDVTMDHLVEEIQPDQIFAEEIQAIGFREKLQKFVDYCQDGAKNREQIAYLESIMEQAMYAADCLR